MCWVLPASGSGLGPDSPKDASDAFFHSDAVFLGTVVAVDNKSGKGSIADVYIQKVWKGAESFEITHVRVNDGGGDRIFEIGKKYLFYVCYPRMQKWEPVGGITIVEFPGNRSMSRIVPVEEAENDFVFFEKLGRPGINVIGAPFPKWQACTEDSECTVVETECPGWKPVNQLYQREMEAHMAYKRPMVDCATYELPLKPNVDCIDGMCREKE